MMGLRGGKIVLAVVLLCAIKEAAVAFPLVAPQQTGERQVPRRLRGPIVRLRSEDATVRYAAARQLAKFGRSAAPAVPALLQAVGDPDQAVRRGALAALRAVGPDALGPEAIPVLIHTLGDNSLDVGLDAASALSQMGAEAVPPLLAALDAPPEGNAFATTCITTALGRIGAPSIPPLLRYLHDSDHPGSMSRAANALGEMGPQAASTIPDLIPLLQAKSAGVRVSAATALGRIGPLAAPAVPAVIPLLDDRNAAVRTSAAAALAEMGKPGVAALIAALGSPSASNRALAAAGLGDYARKISRMPEMYSHRVLALPVSERSPIAPAVPALMTALSDRSPEVRADAAKALGWNNTVSPAALPALHAALADPVASVRAAAAFGLASVGRFTGSDAVVIPALMGAMQDPAPNVRRDAALCLSYFGPKAAPAIPALIAALSDPVDGMYATTTLERVGRSAVPALIAVLHTPLRDLPLHRYQENSRFLAVDTLGRIGPASAPAVPYLLPFLDHPSLLFRNRTLFALRRIGTAALPALPQMAGAVRRNFLEVQQQPYKMNYGILGLDHLIVLCREHAPLLSPREAQERIADLQTVAALLRPLRTADPKRFEVPLRHIERALPSLRLRTSACW